ncbi:GNAT family N-acetyltransferase [Bradyrhizobium sp.]|jgi:GNAT superfamily N-acetyltransferase|uniref:GNAT family N-acetyltransferase n=1 Tax=Bradyrhizobium sp. TaxID=376 RepID=UPI002DFCE511|nr:GNAT family N-acetyltransferase [Bradyrhizobium sp.]
MNANVLIRAIGEDERDAWDPLWAAYLSFYQSTLAQEISDLAWSRFHDPDEPLFALGGYVDGRLLGIAHYLFHRSTWAHHRYCYLEDLFVAEGARSKGLGRALIDEVYRKAEAAGANRVYWLTQSSNAQARALYDKVADNLGFIQYRKVL